MKKSAFLSTGILGILALLIVFAALAMTGVFDAEQPKLLFSSADAEKFYDGTELQNDGWELIDGELKKGHTVEATVFGTQTDAGEAENLMSVIIRNKKGKDVTKLYEIEYQYGLLKVNPAQVTIQAESSAKQYDGTELVCETYKIVSGMMYLNHMLQVENVGERTEVGESLNVPFAKVIDEDGNDVSGNYQFAYVDGSLVVTPHAITVQSAGNQKTYDGTPLTAELAEITAGELLEGHTIEYTYTGSQTTAGKGSNTFGVAIKDANGVNVTHNYTVTTVFGELEVFKRPITVATSDESKVYDGTPLTNTELNLLIGELVAGHTFVPAATGSQTEVGVSENEFDVEIVDQEGNVLSENYEIEKVFGTLEVMARDIVFRSETLEKIYDTEELSSDDIEIALGSLAPGQIAEFDVTGKITDAGSVLNKFTVVIKDSEGNTTTSNYNLQSEFGTLTVLPISITVGSETATKVYDGTELTNDAASIFEGEIFPTHSIELFVTGKQIDAGSSKNTVLAVVYDENGIDVTRNYDITYSYGTLTILKAPITVTSADLFVVYDGKEHKNEASEITAGALVPGQTLEVRFTSKYTDAGAYNNVFAVDIFNEEGERVTYNYDVTRVYGSFVISKRQITIATASDSKVYDGLVLEKHELLNEDEIDLVEGQKLLLSFTSSVINVGSKNNTVTVKIVDEANERKNYTYNYEIKTVLGKLEITPRPITVATASDFKVYDGVALERNELLNEDEIEVVEGQKAIITVTGSQTQKGVSANTVTVKIVDENNEQIDYTRNYNIIRSLGTLEVLPRPISVASASASKVYDGLALERHEILNESEIDLIDGHVLVIRYNNRLTDVGTIDNDFDVYILDENDESKNYTSNYDIHSVYGYLMVVPRPITVISSSATKMYDGLALEKHELEDGEIDLLDGHKLIVEYIGKQINAGSSNNDFDVRIVDASNELIDYTRNYHITEGYGILTVTKRPLAIYSADKAQEYNGEALTYHDDVKLAGELVSGQELKLTFSGEITNVGTRENTYVAQIVDENDESIDYSSNYDIKLFYGKLTVTKRPIIIASASDSREYNGEALIKPEILNFESINIVSGQRIEVVFSDGASQIDVGECDNVFIAKIYAGDEETTYNYNIVYDYGTLTVRPRFIVIKTASDEKVYDGEPLTNPNWEIKADDPSQNILTDHTISVEVTGTRTMVGESNNTLGKVEVTDSFGNDKTFNYDFSAPILGKLIVTDDGTGAGGSGGSGGSGGGGGEDPGSGGSGGSGGTGGSGGSGGGLPNDGSIGSDKESLTDEEAQNQVVFRIRAESTGRIYMRAWSWGDYYGNGFLPTPPTYNELINGKYSAIYLSGLALENSGYGKLSMAIDPKTRDYLLPSYLFMGDEYGNAQASDVAFIGNAEGVYWADYYAYGAYSSYDGIKNAPNKYQAFENKYAEFVKANYMNVPESTRRVMEDIIAEQGFDINDPHVIDKVASYIRNCATYNLEYDRALDKEEDIAVAFLTKDYEGICQHYATAATVLFRSLGLPARYTVGYAASAQEDEWIDVQAKNAHAWVEVYLDNIGWVTVEVTGSSNSDDSSGGGGGGSEGGGGGSDGSETPDDEKQAITVKPQNVATEYTGETIYAPINGALAFEGEIGQKYFDAMGYKLVYTLSGSRTEVGKSDIVISSFDIYDRNGNCVTDKFNITLKTGTLHVYEMALYVTSFDIEAMYTGNALVPDPNGYSYTTVPGQNVTTLLESTHRVVVTFNRSQTTIGSVGNTFSVKVMDGDTDVSVRYKIDHYNGTITVNAAPLVIVTATARHTYDGEAFSCPEWYIKDGYEGNLADGHRIEVTMTSSQTKPGRCENTIDDIKIFDTNGNEVTSNYSIVFEFGKLYVDPPTQQ